LEVVTLDISCILDDKLAKDDAANFPATAQFIKDLATSIETDGQINPITVRKHPTEEGRYLPITGRKRLKALKRLKRDGVLAIIADDLTDDQIRSAIIGDNIWRCPLTKAKHMIAVQEWWKLHCKIKGKKFPGASAATSASDKLSSAPEDGEETEAAEAPEPEPAKPTKAERAEFTAKVRSSSGVTQRAAQRAVQIASTLSEEELAALAAMDATQETMERLARIKDKEARAAAVALVLAGVDADEAIGTRTGEAAKTDEPSDIMVWAASYCGDLLERLNAAGNTASFYAACELYRATKDARAEFAKRSAKGLAASGAKAGNFGAFIKRMAVLAHPKDWNLCGGCQGSGFVEDATLQQASCRKCQGDGWRMAFENR
jgi:ParB family transcriptional regulator, chromosome partitioning protein